MHIVHQPRPALHMAPVRTDLQMCRKGSVLARAASDPRSDHQPVT